MFDIGGPELLVIVLAFIVLFGPKKLPEMVQSFRKGMAHVRKAQTQLKSQIDEIQEEITDATGVDAIKEIRELGNLKSSVQRVSSPLTDQTENTPQREAKPKPEDMIPDTNKEENKKEDNIESDNDKSDSKK